MIDCQTQIDLKNICLTALQTKMPEPITMTILALLAKKKLAVAGGKALAAHAATAAVGTWASSHAALITAIAGTAVLSAILTAIAVALGKFVEAGITSQGDAKRQMENAKGLSERKQKALKKRFEGLVREYGL
jgi:hypothetical protein